MSSSSLTRQRVPIGTKCWTGQSCPVSGKWVFAGYLTGGYEPPPSVSERQIPLSEGEIFPPIRSAGKGCFWRLTEYI